MRTLHKIIALINWRQNVRSQTSHVRPPWPHPHIYRLMKVIFFLIQLYIIALLEHYNTSTSLALTFLIVWTSSLNLCKTQLSYIGKQQNAYYAISSKLYSMDSSFTSPTPMQFKPPWCRLGWKQRWSSFNRGLLHFFQCQSNFLELPKTTNYCSFKYGGRIQSSFQYCCRTIVDLILMCWIGITPLHSSYPMVWQHWSYIPILQFRLSCKNQTCQNRLLVCPWNGCQEDTQHQIYI